MSVEENDVSADRNLEPLLAMVDVATPTAVFEAPNTFFTTKPGVADAPTLNELVFVLSLPGSITK